MAKTEIVEDFCYLGSFISDNGNCDKEMRPRLAKANSIFGRLGKIWANMGLSNVNSLDFTRHSFYQHHGSETWSMTVANMKRIEAAHHKWQRRILRISWKEIIVNEEVRARSGQMKLDITLRQRSLRWLDMFIVWTLNVFHVRLWSGDQMGREEGDDRE